MHHRSCTIRLWICSRGSRACQKPSPSRPHRLSSRLAHPCRACCTYDAPPCCDEPTTDPRAVRVQAPVPRADGHVHSTAHVHPRRRRGGAGSVLVGRFLGRFDDAASASSPASCHGRLFPVGHGGLIGSWRRCRVRVFRQAQSAVVPIALRVLKPVVGVKLFILLFLGTGKSWGGGEWSLQHRRR